MHYVENPPNPWLAHSVEWLGEPPEAKLEVFEETATRRIITHNDSPDVGFDYTVIGVAFTAALIVLAAQHMNILVTAPAPILIARSLSK
jgi:hypothetical protein